MNEYYLGVNDVLEAEEEYLLALEAGDKDVIEFMWERSKENSCIRAALRMVEKARRQATRKALTSGSN